MNSEPATKERSDMYSDSTKKIITAIRETADSSTKAAQGGALLEYKGQPMDIGEYRTACNEFLGVDEVLSEDLLQERIRYILQDSKLKQHLPAGYKCCIAVIPCTQYGFPHEEKDIEDGQHQTNLIVEKDTKNGDKVVKGRTAGFTLNTSYLYHMLPKEIQEMCTFEIPAYESADQYTISDLDRKTIVALYTNAFRQAQKLLNKTPPTQKTAETLN